VVPEDSEGPGKAAGSEGKNTAPAGNQAGGASTREPGGVPSPRTGKAQDAPAQDAPAQAPQDAEDERAELERLRREVADLRGERDSGEDGTRGRHQGRWRAPVSAVLITLGCILAPVSVLGVWAANQVSNTDRYVANMAPLIQQPPIQQALSARITTEITSRINVQAIASQAATQLQANHLTRLANLVRTFAGQIASGVHSAIAAAVSRVVAGPAMAAVWVNANRVAHAGIVRVLSGQGGGSVDVVNNQVVLNLGPLITQAKEQLSARGLSIVNNIPPVSATFPLFEAPNLAKAQQGYRLIVTLKWVLPLLALLAMAVGIYIARRHRRALIGAALGLAASMLVLGIALTIARGVYLNSVPKNLPSTAAAALYDTLIRFIRQGLRVLLVVGLVIAAGAFLAGPSVTAVRIRQGVKSGIESVRTRGERAGVRTGPVGAWTGTHKHLLRVTAVAFVALIFVFWGHPSVAVVIWLLVILLVLLGLVELLGGRPAAPAGRRTEPQR
jgi:hypothetical protein